MGVRLHPHAAARLAERGATETEVETVHVSNELNADLAPGGSIYGIELLNSNEQIAKADTGFLLVVNEVSGVGPRFLSPNRENASKPPSLNRLD